jgi:hypothetical protein
MISYWVPYEGHPDGSSEVPWFRVVDGWGYRTENNPAGASDTPSFRVVDGYAYPTLSMPGDAPTFELIGSFAYGRRGTAWFRIEQRVR